jgi:pimeloyl-ACP methyl ester carboxylesterase
MSNSTSKSTKSKKSVWLVAVSIVLILLGSILAQMFNTSFYSTKVTRISFETEVGTLSGLLYMPKTASENDPRPTIITTHGYLNSAEMQDAGAIELSRRGYVVLALDMYDHGHSIYEKDLESGKEFFSFWPSSLFDAAQYMYDQDYVLKDESGNGIIAVAGHSMGGFSATMAMVMDEQSYATLGLRKIYAGLTMGSDYLWAGYLGATSDVAAAAFGPRFVGKIAAHYDEFFFDLVAESTGETVIRKNYINTTEGEEFLGYPENSTEGTIYTLDNGGKRVIYMPNETHPWNHFSVTTTGHQIDFYTAAFEGFASPDQDSANLASDSQIWFLKELFEFVALVGFFLLFIPLISLLLKVPFFSKAKTEANLQIEGPKTLGGKSVFWLIIVFCTLFPALYFPTLMDKTGTGMKILKVSSLVVIALSVVFGIYTYVKKGKEKIKPIIIGTLLTAVSGLILFFLTLKASNLFKTNSYFNAPTVNQILYWALVVTAVTAIIALACYYLDKKPNKTLLKQYGFVTNWKAILAALATSIVVVVVGFLILLIVSAVFKTDFRIWVWAVKTFELKHIVSCLRYLPFFFLYYYVTGITINANTDFIKGWKGYLVGCIVNVGGLVLYIIAQYGKLFITGKALWPTQALSSILLFALVPTLIVATIYTKALYKKTGNVYTGVFLNTILMTMITIANTIVYTNLL